MIFVVVVVVVAALHRKCVTFLQRAKTNKPRENLKKKGTKQKEEKRKQSAVTVFSISNGKVSRPLLKRKPLTFQINICLYSYF